MKLGITNLLVNNPLLCVPLSERPKLNLNFALGDYTTNGFASQPSVGSTSINLPAVNGPAATFTRASGATYRYSDGYLRYAPENLLTRSQEFDNASWTRLGFAAFGSGSVANAIASPDGSLTADLLKEQSGTSGRAIYQSVSSQSQLFTLSAYVKKYGRQYCGIQSNDGVSAGAGAAFDLDGKSLVGYTSIGSGWSASEASIIDVGDGWLRVSVKISATSLSPKIMAIQLRSSNSTSWVDEYAGDTTKGIYIWGAQLERHSSARPYISTVASQVFGPRFEYDTSGNPIGLLIEESSTNLLTYSEQFDNAAWTKTALNTSGSPAWVNAYTAPNGLQVSDKIIPNTTNTFHDIRSAASFSMQAGINTVSVYARAGGYNFFEILVASTNALSKYATVVINLSDGSDAGTGVYQTWSLYNLSTKSVGDGWYRINFAFNVDALTTTGLIIFSSLPTSSRGVQFAGDGSSGVYLFGAQLEAKPFATSYIPTVASQQQRSEDFCDAALPLGLLNPSQGTIVVTADRTRNPDVTAASGGDPTIEFEDDGGSGLSMVQYYDSASAGGESVYYGGSLGAQIAFGDVSVENQLFTVGWTYNDGIGEVNASIDGGAPSNGPAAGSIIYPNKLNIGFSTILNQRMNGHITSVQTYNKDFSAKLQTYTD